MSVPTISDIFKSISKINPSFKPGIVIVDLDNDSLQILCKFLATDPSLTELEIPSYEMFYLTHNRKNIFDALKANGSLKKLVIRGLPFHCLGEVTWPDFCAFIRDCRFTSLGLVEATFLERLKEDQITDLMQAFKANSALAHLDLTGSYLGDMSTNHPKYCKNMSSSEKQQYAEQRGRCLKLFCDGLAAKPLTSLILCDNELEILAPSDWVLLTNAIQKSVRGYLDLSQNKLYIIYLEQLEQLFATVNASGLNRLNLEDTGIRNSNTLFGQQLLHFIKGTEEQRCPLTELRLPLSINSLDEHWGNGFQQSISWLLFFNALQASSICSMPGFDRKDNKELSDKQKQNLQGILKNNQFKQELTAADAIFAQKPIATGGITESGKPILSTLPAPIVGRILSFCTDKPVLSLNGIKATEARRQQKPAQRQKN